jgi:hypothetical protein
VDGVGRHSYEVALADDLQVEKLGDQPILYSDKVSHVNIAKRHGLQEKTQPGDNL